MISSHSFLCRTFFCKCNLLIFLYVLITFFYSFRGKRRDPPPVSSYFFQVLCLSFLCFLWAWIVLICACVSNDVHFLLIWMVCMFVCCGCLAYNYCFLLQCLLIVAPIVCCQGVSSTVLSCPFVLAYTALSACHFSCANLFLCSWLILNALCINLFPLFHG